MASASSSSISPGRLLYLLFHRPRVWLQDRRDLAAGRRGEIAMRSAAAALTPAKLPDWGLTGPACRFLTGARFVHQTIFCARSFEWACDTHVRLEIFDDGTLGPADLAALHRALPHAGIIRESAAVARLDRVLSEQRFPVLRHMRAGQPLMRKLLDLHAGLAGPALYLDSDMLFFGRPAVLRDWLKTPHGDLFMQQHGDALVGDRAELARTFGIPLLEGVNSGIIAVDGRDFDWPGLEAAATLLTATQRSHKWAEQTLFAWLLSRRQATPLSRADYFLCHQRADLGPTPPPLRHYVHKSKVNYVAGEWRRWLELSRTASP
jgi:hypothetical protein